MVSALTFNAILTAASKKSATFAKSSSTNPLDVRAGVPGSSQRKSSNQMQTNSDVQFELGTKDVMQDRPTIHSSTSLWA